MKKTAGWLLFLMTVSPVLIWGLLDHISKE